MNLEQNASLFKGECREHLDEIHDCLTLALDATERPCGYNQSEREARSYLRSAMRRVGKLRAEQIGGAA